MKLFFNPVANNQNEKKYYDENRIIRRLFLIAFFMTTIGLVIFSKIIEISILNEKKVINYSYSDKKINTPMRGVIKDRNGKILASNIFKYKLKAYPKLISNPAATAEILIKQIRGLDKNRIIKQISNKSKYEVIVARNITAREAKYLNGLGVPGLEFFPYWIR